MSRVMYKHYKGGLYEAIGNAVHTETGELLMIYADEHRRLWARPNSMFFGEVEVDGKKVKRFERVFNAAW